MHRDVKLENVMLERPTSDAQIKLIDFGYATRHVNTEPPLTAFVGTAYATSPEIFKESYHESCDMWAVGVITYAMLCGQRPFVGREIRKIANSKYRSMVADIMSADYVWPITSRGLSKVRSDEERSDEMTTLVEGWSEATAVRSLSLFERKALCSPLRSLHISPVTVTNNLPLVALLLTSLIADLHRLCL